MLPAVVDQKACLAAAYLSILAVYSYISKKKTLFSAQDLIDCDTHNWGCSGGHPVNSMFYIQKNGLSDGNAYKYIAKNQTCQKAKYPSIKSVKMYPCGTFIDGKNFTSDYMKALIVSMGPLTVPMSKFSSNIMVDDSRITFLCFTGVNMPSQAFFNYKAGIFTDTTCSKNITMSDTFVVSDKFCRCYEPKSDYFIFRQSWVTVRTLNLEISGMSATLGEHHGVKKVKYFISGFFANKIINVIHSQATSE
jgi:Papain family cysteine protease